MDPKRTKDGVEDELDLLHEPEPDADAPAEPDEEGAPPGSNFV